MGAGEDHIAGDGGSGGGHGVRGVRALGGSSPGCEARWVGCRLAGRPWRAALSGRGSWPFRKPQSRTVKGVCQSGVGSEALAQELAVVVYPARGDRRLRRPKTRQDEEVEEGERVVAQPGVHASRGALQRFEQVQGLAARCGPLRLDEGIGTPPDGCDRERILDRDEMAAHGHQLLERMRREVELEVAESGAEVLQGIREAGAHVLE